LFNIVRDNRNVLAERVFVENHTISWFVVRIKIVKRADLKNRKRVVIFLKKFLKAVCFCAITLLICSTYSDAFGETFTIAVIPDSQCYVSNYCPQPASANIFINEAQFIVNNRAAMNIVFVSHLGDIWNNSNTPAEDNERTRSVSAMNILKDANIPMGIVAGNHDYDQGTGNGYTYLSGSTLWTSYYGASTSYFSGKSWYGGSYINSSDTNGMTSWQTFHAGPWDFLHIALEIEPSDDVLAWVQNVINTHPGWPTIVTIHEYINPIGQYMGVAGDYTSVLRLGHPYNSDQQVWDKFIKVNPQIFMVLCGHAFLGDAYCTYKLITPNSSGYNVYQILSDYQDTKSSNPDSLGHGGGWLRLMEFDTTLKTIHVRTYSVILGKYSNDPSLADYSTYAKYWTAFNYASPPFGSGNLYLPTDLPSSDFTLPLTLGTTPVDCNDAISKGHSLYYDLNGDCRVNFRDFVTINFEELASFAEAWLDCFDPADASCTKQW
jgi:hypothetical protein